jgi:hypothetical protein
MNRMHMVAGILGLAWDSDNDRSEGFYVGDNTKNINHIHLNGTIIDDKGDVYPCLLMVILEGGAKIKRVPWRPKIGNKYFYADITGPHLWAKSEWDGSATDIQRFDLGIIFKETHEAVAKSKEMILALGFTQEDIDRWRD